MLEQNGMRDETEVRNPFSNARFFKRLRNHIAKSLILFRNGDWTEEQVRTRLSEILAGLTERDIAQSIIVVDRDRVRRRRLPIE